MTFDEFKVDFLAFLDSSTVNLGRKTANTRQVFITEATAKFEAFISAIAEIPVTEKTLKNLSPVNPMSGSVMRIKPNNRNKALDVGKGVHAMTSSESMRADEQLDRSPFGANSKSKKTDDE